MTILALLLIVVVACLAAWFADRSGWPEPFKWLVYAIIVVVLLGVLLDLSGVHILSQRL